MRARDLLPLAIIGGIGAFIVVQSRSIKSPPPPPAPPPRRDTLPPVPQVRPIEPRAPNSAAPAAPTRDDDAIRRQLDEGAPGTYVREMLKQDQQMLKRWPDGFDAVHVWIERDPNVTNWVADFPVVVERTFDEWHQAGFPIRFDFQPDSAGASLMIRWVNAIPDGERAIGVTRTARDQDGFIRRAEILIATHTKDGRTLTPATVAGVARHEVGHALGLGHSNSPADVMYPESTTPVISRADRATLHLLYTLPPGVVK